MDPNKTTCPACHPVVRRPVRSGPSAGTGEFAFLGLGETYRQPRSVRCSKPWIWVDVPLTSCPTRVVTTGSAADPSPTGCCNMSARTWPTCRAGFLGSAKPSRSSRHMPVPGIHVGVGGLDICWGQPESVANKHVNKWGGSGGCLPRCSMWDKRCGTTYRVVCVPVALPRRPRWRVGGW